MISKLKFKFPKETVFSLGLLIVAAVSITLTGIQFHQQFFRILPLFISLIVGMFQAKANRYAPLIGSLNSLIYTAVYFSFGIYASAFSALLISFPFQMATFIRWNKHAYKNSTEFRRMTSKNWAVFLTAFVTCICAMYLSLTLANSNYRLIDSLLTTVGLFTSTLTMLGYIEYTWFHLCTSCLTVVLDITMMQQYPAQITYLIYSSYSCICLTRQLFSVRKIYKEQTLRKDAAI